MTQRPRKIFTLLAIGGALAAAAVPAAQARHGADDPVGHDVGDDHGGLVRDGGKAEARHRHRHHGRHHRAHHGRHGGRDDGPNHDAGDDRGTR